VQNRGLNLDVFFSILLRLFSALEFAQWEKMKGIFGLDLLQFYGGYFYYKYRHCISVNLEIEGTETRV